MFYYFNVFYLCSFLGFLLETSLKLLFFPHMNNGILFGPWIPVYGFGGVVVLLISHYVFRKTKMSKMAKTLVTFLIVMVLVTILEWLGGTFIELLFDKVYWDYSHMKFNFGPYISLEMSLLWGIFSIIFIYLIMPIEEKIIKKIPKWVTILVTSDFFIDVIFTFISLKS